MSKRRIKSESIENLKKVVDNKENVSTVTSLDPVETDAYSQSEAASKHSEDVKDELDKKASTVVTSSPDTGKEIKNDYTAQLILDENMSDFNLSEEGKEPVKDGRAHKLYDNDENEDDYLDYDMFDFIYGLVTDCWPKPKNPLNHRIRKFMYIGSDDYIKTNSYTGVSQVATSGDTIEVYSNNAKDFNDIKEICDMYKFKYNGPNAKKSSSSHWNFSFNIYVPTSRNGYPEMVEDYFEDLGMTLEDVMPADFCKQYRKKQSRIDTEVNKRLVDIRVNKAIMKAARDQEPLDKHISDLYQELDSAGFTYDKEKIEKSFKKAFPDVKM